MPRDMMMGDTQGTQKNEKKERITLNLEALGEAAQKNVMEDNKKIQLTQHTEAEIIKSELSLDKTIHHNKDDPKKIFYKLLIFIETQFNYTDENGKVQTGTSRDGYSGLRYIPKTDENGEVLLDATGEPQLERLWVGPSSKCGQLFKLAKDYDTSIKTFSDFISFLQQPNRKCMIMTQNSVYDNNTYVKQFIQKFI